MAKPVIYFDNMLRRARAGDDGTKYATGINAVRLSDNEIGTNSLAIASDVAAVSSLIGTGVQFDSTGNTYIITDIHQAMEAAAATLTLGSGEDVIQALATDGQYLYCGLNISPGKIARISLSTFTQDGATITLASGEGYINDMVISGIYLYAGLSTSAGKIVRVNLTTWAIDGSTVTLGSGEDYISALDTDGVYLYASCYVTPSKIVRVLLSTFTKDGTVVTLGSGENNVDAIRVAGGYLYAGTWTGPGIVARINLGTFAKDGTSVTLASGDNGIVSMATDNEYLYLGLDTNPGKIARVKLSTFAQNGTTVTLQSGEEQVISLTISGYYLYAGLHQSPGKVARIRLSTFLQDGSTLTLSSGENNPYSILFYENYNYVGCATTAGKIIKRRALAEIAIFERLQDADVGDGFSIKAGITCAQQDASAIAAFSADNALSPVHKGIVNTGYYLRAHLPNMLQDGGFESGAFSPNWTAGANWAIESSTPLEGIYAASWNLGASNHLQQSGIALLEKGRTYRLVIKAKSVTANPTSGAVTVQLKQTTSGTDVDADASGTALAITTTSTWFSVDFTPEFTTANWYLKILTDHTKANGATEVTVDELYFYEKPTVTTLIIGRHNLEGKTGLVVKSWKCSPLRSTAGTDESTEIKASFTVDTADTYYSALTTAYDPVYELYIPAVSSWAPEVGEIYLGASWALSHYPKGPLDPYKTTAEGLREITLQFGSLAPALRTTTIKDFFAKVRNGDAWWCKWESDQPVLMGTPREAQEAAYNPYRISMTIRGQEKT